MGVAEGVPGSFEEHSEELVGNGGDERLQNGLVSGFQGAPNSSLIQTIARNMEIPSYSVFMRPELSFIAVSHKLLNMLK